MPTPNSRAALRAPFIVAACLVLLLATGCSGGEDDDRADTGLPTLTGSEAGASETAGVGTDDEDAALAFSACIRGQGIEFPDLGMNADGSVSMGDTQALSAAMNDSGFDDAFEACEGELQGATFDLGSGDMTELEDQLVDMAACMRDLGYEAEDPDLGAGLSPDVLSSPFGPGVDVGDPDVLGDLEACAEEIDLRLPGIGQQ